MRLSSCAVRIGQRALRAGLIIGFAVGFGCSDDLPGTSPSLTGGGDTKSADAHLDSNTPGAGADTEGDLGQGPDAAADVEPGPDIDTKDIDEPDAPPPDATTCSSDSDCAAELVPCKQASCESGVCQVIAGPEGTPCDDGDG